MKIDKEKLDRIKNCNDDVLKQLIATGYYVDIKRHYLIKCAGERVMSSEWSAEFFIVKKLKKEYELEGIPEMFNVMRAKSDAKKILKKLPRIKIKFL